MATRCWPECTLQREALVERAATLPAGSVLWCPGAEIDGLYLVRSGALKVTRTDRSGTERVLCFALPGDVAGFEDVARQRRDTRAETLATTSLCHIGWPPSTGDAATGSALLLPLLQRASALLHRRSRALHRLEPLPALREFVTELARSIGRAEGEGAAARTRVQLPMTRLEIGQYLGYSEETVCRTLRHLHRLGELQINGRTLLLPATGQAEAH